MPLPQQLPADINAEVLMNYYPEGTMKVSLQGLHKRNSYRDVIQMEEMGDGGMHVTLGRMSIYNTLPEFMFHPIDRFDNLPQNDPKEAFYEQLQEQEQEITDAYRFFLPIDVLLFKLRAELRAKLEQYTDGNVVMQRVIGDRLTEEQLGNRFIAKLVPFLPLSKNIRGNSTLLTLLLRKVFMEEGLRISVNEHRQHLNDEEPRYGNRLDMELGDSYVGNEYDDTIVTYDIHYWSDSECGKDFPRFLDEIEALRCFIRDYFLSVETELRFDLTKDTQPVRLGDEHAYNYLNYNINI